MGVVVDSYSETNRSTQSALSADNFHKLGQSITGNGTNLDNIQLFMRKQGSPPSTFRIYVYAHTGTYGSSSLPTGSALATSDAFTANSLTTSFALTALTFSGANRIFLTNATKYFVSLEYASGDLSNAIQAGDDNTSPTHAGNEAFDSGSGWTVNTTRDLCFYVYGIAPSGGLLLFL